jgi:hypothetical protein
MSPPFKYEKTGSLAPGDSWVTSYRIVDNHGDLMAQDIQTEEFARLACGLLNGHFHVPVVLTGSPIQFSIKSL